MSLLSLDDARDQCRVDPGYPAEQLQPYVDAAEAAACAYLNLAVFVTQDALAAAQDAVPDAMAAASTAYGAATTAAAALADEYQRRAALEIACARFDAAKANAFSTIHGIVVNPAIVAAIRLTLGHLFANREDVLTGLRAAAVDIPGGAQDLLRPYRRTMMP